MHNQSEEKNSESISVPKNADVAGMGVVLSNETWEHLKNASLQAMVNAMPDPSLLCDLKGYILHSSTGFEKLTGIQEKSRITGTNFISFLTQEDIELSLLNFDAVSLGNNEKVKGVYSVRRNAKDALKAEVIFTSVKDHNFPESFVLLTFKDISHLTEVEDAASKNQIRLSLFNRVFQDFSPSPEQNINRLTSLVGELTGASSSCLNLFQNGEYIPLSAWNSPFLPDFDPEPILKILLNHYKGIPEQVLQLSKPQLLADFKVYPQFHEPIGVKSIIGLPLLSGGQLLGMVHLVFTSHGQFRDQDKEFCSLIASALVLECNRMKSGKPAGDPDLNYRELFDFFSDSIYILDQQGKFIDVNIGATHMYGYDREEMIGMSVAQLSAPGKNDLEKNLDAIKNAYDGESSEFEWWGIRKNGEVFPKNVVLNKGKYFGKDVVIATGRDISEQKKAEGSLMKHNLELTEINQSKDKFFSILAHDLKNPFGGLLGFIDLLYEDIDELSTDLVKEYLQNIRTASYHTYSLLENLLEWSRIQTGKVQFHPSQFDLYEEIESVIKVLDANAVRKNVKLINLVEPGITAEADRNMIHSVIQNLVTNAIKFSNSKSNVTISGKYSLDDGLSEKRTEPDKVQKRWYEISVTDTGIGIPEDILPRLFKLDGQFSMTGTANEPGTGLGLILCKEMVEKNGGHIRAESLQNNGSTFSFTLPLID